MVLWVCFPVLFKLQKSGLLCPRASWNSRTLLHLIKCLTSHFLVHHTRLLMLSSILVSLLKKGSQVTSTGSSLLGCQVTESSVLEQGLQLTDLWHVEIPLNTDKGESFQIGEFLQRGLCTGKWVLQRAQDLQNHHMSQHPSIQGANCKRAAKRFTEKTFSTSCVYYCRTLTHKLFSCSLWVSHCCWVCMHENVKR